MWNRSLSPRAVLTCFLWLPPTPQPHTPINPARVTGNPDVVSFLWHSQGPSSIGVAALRPAGEPPFAAHRTPADSHWPHRSADPGPLSLKRSKYRKLSRGTGSQQWPKCHGWATGNRNFRTLRTFYYQLTRFPVFFFMCPSKSHRLLGHEWSHMASRRKKRKCSQEQ